MGRSFNTASFRSQMNRVKSQLRQAERNINNKINDYNKAVKKYNSDLRSVKRKIDREFNKLRTINNTSNYYKSSELVHYKFIKVTERYENGNIDEDLYTAIENENANSLALTNVVVNNEEPTEADIELNDSEISNKLLIISPDLNSRWLGALYSLNPNNPEAARHFCTSTREILKVLIDDGIDNKKVQADDPNCEKTPNGTPSRKSKIKYAMKQKGLIDDTITDFAQENIENTVSLINELSNGTHGHSSKYSINQLKIFKKRFEDCICFICNYIV